jgi:hypothetical protein
LACREEHTLGLHHKPGIWIDVGTDRRDRHTMTEKKTSPKSSSSSIFFPNRDQRCHSPLRSWKNGRWLISPQLGGKREVLPPKSEIYGSCDAVDSL